MPDQFPSRKERRAFAKKFGLSGKKESLDQYIKRVGRAGEYGKQIHLQHLQNQENKRLDLEKNEE